METKSYYLGDVEAALPVANDIPKLSTDDSYNCISCPYPIKILKIDDSKNTLTFKCLNPKEKEPQKTIPISEYLNSMKKYTYLYNECSLCHKKQNEFKDTPIFSYCTKCEEIICFDCRSKHLKLNEKNHPNLDNEYFIKNNEKNTKCLLHPNKKNIAFCFNCNTHICKECKKNKKHMEHRKHDIIEVSITDEIKSILNSIINITKKEYLN